MTNLRAHRRNQERGFALLLIFAFAAAAAIGIYMEMPRAVFESARAKEELLVERGNEYKTAIKRFYVQTKGKYPQSLDELEKTNGVRFLRRRYKDPMTGTDEWRLVHIGPMGFTDSKVFKPTQPQQQQKEVRQSSVSEGYSLGMQTQPTDGQKGVQGIAMRQRPGDKLPATPGQEPPQGQQPQETVEVGPSEGVQADPAAVAGSSPGADQPNAPGTADAAGTNAPPPVPGQQPANPLAPQPPVGGPVPGAGGAVAPPPAPGTSMTPTPQPGAPGQPVGPQPGQNPAIAAIQGMLTNPRQGPVPTTGNPTQQGQQPGGFVGGIAGVASKYEGEGIKRINERSKIEEWEFLFDHRQMQGQQGQQNQQGGPRGNQGQQGNQGLQGNQGQNQMFRPR